MPTSQCTRSVGISLLATATVFSPKPSDGPLDGLASPVRLTVSLPTMGRLVGAIIVPGRPPIEVPATTLFAGNNRISISLPRGGVPPGSELRLLVRDINGLSSVAIYTFQ